jgi:glutathione synthase
MWRATKAVIGHLLFSASFFVHSFLCKLSKSPIAVIKSSSLHTSDDSVNVKYQDIAKHASIWAILNGLVYANDAKTWIPAPISLTPARFSRNAYEYVVNIQPYLNHLIDAISRDKMFVVNTLEQLTHTDEFVKNLLDIYKDFSEQYLKDCIQLGLLRSDYMINNDGYVETPLQVEINTVASSFGCLSEKVGLMQKNLLTKYSNDPNMKQLISEIDSDFESTKPLKSSSIPDNISIASLARGLAHAHGLYKNPSAFITFVVQPGERNVMSIEL